ncbi:MAG: hypothetical protein EOO38_24325 [Cytophagaceae bacterium]|nr:MAG: hypothetical protein EOO38_24325 [Cytophagaceae bacterium]
MDGKHEMDKQASKMNYSTAETIFSQYQQRFMGSSQERPLNVSEGLHGRLDVRVPHLPTSDRTLLKAFVSANNLKVYLLAD